MSRQPHELPENALCINAQSAGIVLMPDGRIIIHLDFQINAEGIDNSRIVEVYQPGVPGYADARARFEQLAHLIDLRDNSNIPPAFLRAFEERPAEP